MAFLGCEDDNTTNQENLTPIIEGRKVYISGFYQDSTLDQMVACYWVDGIRVDLEYGAAAVSYTHLTLPTNREV